MKLCNPFTYSSDTTCHDVYRTHGGHLSFGSESEMNSAIEKIRQPMHVKGFIDGKWQALFFGYDCYGAPDIATVHQTFGEKAGNDWRAFIQKRRDEIHASTCLSTFGGGEW